MSRIALAAAGLVAALALAAPIGATSSATKLNGTVGPGFTITLKKGTAKVKTLRHGKYTITVNDKSNIHDFHLKGPGVNKVITTTPFKGKKTVTVTLKKGTYRYVCDPHAAQMKGSFKVT
ncbi:MAG TPA: plastocyanin/azurin family copper-binding protein [Gaiella sp.]